MIKLTIRTRTFNKKGQIEYEEVIELEAPAKHPEIVDAAINALFGEEE